MATTKTYFDYSFRGEIDSNGNMVSYTGSEAVANAVRAWMASFKGEVLRKPTIGGNLVNLLMKPLSEDMALLVREQLVLDLKKEFIPRILVSSITVTPVYEQDYYEIKIKGYCPSVRDKIELDESIKRIFV